MRGRIGYTSVTAAFLLCSCTTATPVATLPPAPTVTVPAAGETLAVATRSADAADDPAIFAPAGGLTAYGRQHDGILLGTDKKAGLYVFALTGESLQFLPEGLLNNVDLRATAGGGFVAGASDRGRMGVALYRFAGAGPLVAAGFIGSDVVEPYGFCMGRVDGALIAVLVAKDGAVREYTLTDDGTTITGTERRRYAVGTQSEGCVIDDATGTLYVGEELHGVWRYPLNAAPGTRTLVAGLGDGRLVADVEGVTLIRDRDETFLIVSSQGDSAFAVWQVDGAPGAERYLGRFRVGAANGVDAVTGTDGVDAWSGPAGSRFERGLIAVQDDVNEGQTQNFKLVGWAEVRAALER